MGNSLVTEEQKTLSKSMVVTKRHADLELMYGLAKGKKKK